jgi:hypothetical protein
MSRSTRPKQLSISLCRMTPGSRVATVLLMSLAVAACNRAALRVPGASMPFPETRTGYVARTTYPLALVVAAPIDRRPQHYSARVAGTRWTGCSTDPFWAESAAQVIRDSLVIELRASGVFREVSKTEPKPGALVLKTSVDAFCSQAVGFLFVRVAGIIALHVTIERNGATLLDHKFEKVVTDADPAYTGSSFATLEQAMTTTMGDSLRELFKQMLPQIDAAAATWTDR